MSMASSAQPPSAFAGPSGIRPLLVAVAVAAAAALAATSVYLWQSPKVRDARTMESLVRSDLASREHDLEVIQAEVTSLLDERSRLREDARGLQARVDHLTQRGGDLKATIGSLHDRIGELVANAERLRGDLVRAEARAAAAREQLVIAHERAVVSAGPSLADGRYLGWIQGIDVASSPARIAVRVTARSNGTSLALPGWRVFTLGGEATVRLRTWKDGRDVSLTLGRFERVFDGSAPWNAEMRSVRYWIHVVDGRVVGLGELAGRRG